MNTIKVSTFKDGKKGYSTGNIEISFCKKDPVSVKEITITDRVYEDFIANPEKIKHIK